jgi:hypothetical protein
MLNSLTLATGGFLYSGASPTLALATSGFIYIESTGVVLSFMGSTATIYGHEFIRSLREATPKVTLYPAEGDGVHIRNMRQLNVLLQLAVKRIEILEKA